MHPLWLIPLAFLAGSIPFGYLIGLARGVDVRRQGSGNIGATNVGRVLGRRWGMLCFGLDFLKGCVPTLAAGAVLGTIAAPTAAPLADIGLWLGAMAATVLGHMFTPWLGFKGGKGVATGFGALMGLWPVLTIPALLAFVVWFVVLKATRYMSLASCLAAASLPIWVVLVDFTRGAREGGGWPVWPYFVTALVLGALVVFKHRANIARLRTGTEPKVGVKKPATTGN